MAAEQASRIGLARYAAASGAAALGIVLSLWATSRYGPGLSPDSAEYVATARHLAAGKGNRQSDGEICTHWPPLYGGLLAGFALVGVDPLESARWVNAAAFAHLAAAIPNYAVMEPQLHGPEVAALVERPFAERDGHREIPDRPGIGVEIDEEACARLPFEGVPITGFFHACAAYPVSPIEIELLY